MARRVSEGVIQDTPNLISSEEITPQSDNPVLSTEVNTIYNQEEGKVSFSLEDGTQVVMKSPKTRQFLLLESFIKSVEPEYKTESFIAIKLASLCITKFGNEDKISFDNLLDNLEINDLERVAEAITCFRDKLESIARG
jgi:hypothetical protein